MKIINLSIPLFKTINVFALKSLGMILLFIFQILLSRSLGPTLYGEYTVYITFTNIISIFTVFGLDNTLIKEIPLYNEGEKKYILRISLIFSLFLTLIFLTVLIFLNILIDSLNFNFLLLFLLVLLKTLASIIDGYLQGKKQIVKATFHNNFLNNFLKIPLFLLFIFLNFNYLYSAIISYILSEFISLISRLVRFNFHTINYSEKFDSKIFFKYSFTLALVTGISLLLQNIDKIMISILLDYSDVGMYRISQNYVLLIGIFITPTIIFWPIISELYKKREIKLIELKMKKIILFISHIVIPVYVIIFFFQKDLLSIFGQEYITTDGQIVLIILTTAFLFDALAGPVGSLLTMTKYAHIVLINNLVGIMVNILLNIMLVENFGIKGIAFATGFVVLFVNIVSIIEVKFIIGIRYFNLKYFIKIVILLIGNLLFGFILNKIFIFNKEMFNFLFFSIVILISNFALFYFSNKKFFHILLHSFIQKQNNL